MLLLREMLILYRSSTDSLLKLSQESIQINIIHKAVGQITESDILFISA